MPRAETPLAMISSRPRHSRAYLGPALDQSRTDEGPAAAKDGDGQVVGQEPRGADVGGEDLGAPKVRGGREKAGANTPESEDCEPRSS